MVVRFSMLKFNYGYLCMRCYRFINTDFSFKWLIANRYGLIGIILSLILNLWCVGINTIIVLPTIVLVGH